MSVTSALPVGPTITASTPIRSPTRWNVVSVLINDLDARGPHWTSSGMDDSRVGVGELDLVQRAIHRGVVANDARRMDRTISFAIYIEKTDPLVWVAATDLGPERRGLRRSQAVRAHAT